MRSSDGSHYYQAPFALLRLSSSSFSEEGCRFMTDRPSAFLSARQSVLRPSTRLPGQNLTMPCTKVRTPSPRMTQRAVGPRGERRAAVTIPAPSTKRIICSLRPMLQSEPTD